MARLSAFADEVTDDFRGQVEFLAKEKEFTRARDARKGCSEGREDEREAPAPGRPRPHRVYPNHEADMPNFLKADAAIKKLQSDMLSNGSLNIDDRLAQLVQELQTIFNGS